MIHLGTGSYAHVYLVEDDHSNRFAVKWLRADSEPHGPERFENEKWALEQLAPLGHLSIPKLVETETLDGRPYLVMTLAPGENLRIVSQRQRRQFETMGQMRVLLIAEAVLDALANIHKLQICHRDVKDANVLVAGDGDNANLTVTLVDFGMCKGRGQPADAETFFGAGSARFSPPSKLLYSGQALPNQDVFAVGVLGYLLLTNYFPWEFPLDADSGKFRDHMLGVVPPTIRQLNNKVRREVSEFFGELLKLDDSQRPNAREALAKLREVKERMASISDGGANPHNLGIFFPRVVRDPIHLDIPMSDFEWELINTREFQRLRWLRQLGTSHLVYPGAEHSRFSHAIGTMHVASEILRRFEERTGTRFDGDELQIARAYSLLHDVSHIPYGHALEDEMRIFERHDQNKGRIERLLQSDRSQLGRKLGLSSIGREVLQLLTGNESTAGRAWISQLVAAPCGADVLDYVDRDAYYCGLDHRIDSAIYRRFNIDRTYVGTDLYGHHGLRLDASFALESILRERLALYLKVYAHPVKVAAGAMIGKAVSKVLALKRSRFSESAIEWMGDHDLLQFLRSSRQPLAKRLVEMLVGKDGRSVWKPAFGGRVLRNGTPGQAYKDQQSSLEERSWFDSAGRDTLEAKIGEKAGVSSENLIFYCPKKAPGLQRLRQYVALDPVTRVVQQDQELYARIYNAHINLWTAYVFVPPTVDRDTVTRVANAAASVLELENEVDLRPKQLGLFL
jgi:uncharacterized protein